MKTWNFTLFIVIVIILCIVQTFLNTEVFVNESYTQVKSMALIKTFIIPLFAFLAGLSLFFENLLAKAKGYLNKKVLLFSIIFLVLSLNRVLLIALSIPINNVFIYELLIMNDFFSIIFGFSSGALLCFIRLKMNQ